MYPATAGMIRGLGIRHTEMTVSCKVLYPETEIHVEQQTGEISWSSAYIVLDDEGRRELIELLGGTP